MLILGSIGLVIGVLVTVIGWILNFLNGQR